MYNTKGRIINGKYIEFFVKGEDFFNGEVFKFSSYIDTSDYTDTFWGNIVFKRIPSGSYTINGDISYGYGGDKKNEIYLVLVPTDGGDNLILRGKTYSSIHYDDVDKDEIYGSRNGNWERADERFSRKYYEDECDDYCEEYCKIHPDHFEHNPDDESSEEEYSEHEEN